MFSTTEGEVRSGVYIIRCIANGKVYIGSSVDVCRRWNHHKRMLNGNQHRNYRLQNSWDKYGCDQFIWGILEYVYEEDLLEEVECEYITRYKSDDRQFGFNSKLANGRLSEESIHKISEAQRGNQYSLGHKHSEESKLKMSESLRGRKLSEEHKRKISDSGLGNQNNLGKKHTEETKRKIGNAHFGNQYSLGKKYSEEHKKKIGDALRGREISEEQKLKISEAMSGRKISEEHKQKIRDGHQRRKVKESGGIICF